MRPTVLVSETDNVLRMRLSQALRDHDYEVSSTGFAEHAVQLAECDSPEFALLDLQQHCEAGLLAVQRLHALDATTHIVVFIGLGCTRVAREAVRAGATRCLRKPADLDEVLAALDHGKANASEAVSANRRGDLELSQIEAALRRCEGDSTRAARLLGVHRRVLLRQLDH